MATRDIYRHGFDEDVTTTSSPSSRCPECDGVVRTNSIETSCEDCGLVIEEEPIDHGPEWMPSEAEERRRNGAPLTPARHDRGLSTTIGRGVDAKGNTLPGRKRRQLGRLRREQSRIRWRSKAERNLGYGLGEVRRVASALDLSASTRDQACQLFRRAQSEELLQGRSIEAIAAASVYAACRCSRISRLLEEIIDVAHVEEVSVTNAYNTLNAELGLPAKPQSPAAYVPRLAAELDCPSGVRRRAREIVAKAENADVTNGAHPAGFAAGCLYRAGLEEGYRITQMDAAEAANVSPATVRSHKNTLEELLA